MAKSDRPASGAAGTVRSEPDLLGIYLNDHFAVMTGEVELVRRAARSQRGLGTGDALKRLTVEIVDDRAALLDMMAAIDVSVRRTKSSLAWAAEKVGRLKPNGYVLRRSPLSSLVELEALQLLVEGKAAAWRTLRTLADRDRRLNTERLEELLTRARRQLDTVEQLRVRTATEVFNRRA